MRGLERRVTDDTIESVWIGSRTQPLKSSAALICRTLEGKGIAAVRRAGKHIVFELKIHSDDRNEAQKKNAASATRRRLRERAAPGARVSRKPAIAVDEKLTDPIGEENGAAHWVVHLGMTGRMLVCDPAAEVAKHTHLIARLASGRELRFVDPRMFGKLSVHSYGFDPGGVEPLEVSEANFIALFRGRKTPIKSALLNQKLVRGVGNIYADESLFRAGIRPRRRAASITRQDLSRLYHSVREVLREAIAAGGSSVSDYVDADGEAGFFQLEHRVYGREGEPCRNCGSTIRRIVLGGRSSHYCPNCQR